jgi:D-alanine-D-alanine ligase-like ATP-grasp enzyme
LDNIDDRCIHLTNNSVNKKSKNFDKENGFLSQAEAASWLDAEYGEGSWKEVKKKMVQQMKESLVAASDNGVKNRKNSCAVYGYDFCLDDKCGVWLIEVNSSPDFSFSSVRNFIRGFFKFCRKSQKRW